MKTFDLLDISNPVFRAYIVTCSVLALKMFLMSPLTSIHRFSTQVIWNWFFFQCIFFASRFTKWNDKRRKEVTSYIRYWHIYFFHIIFDWHLLSNGLRSFTITNTHTFDVDCCTQTITPCILRHFRIRKMRQWQRQRRSNSATIVSNAFEGRLIFFLYLLSSSNIAAVDSFIVSDDCLQ